MTKQELELVEKVLDSERIYMVAKYENAIYDMVPTVVRNKDCLLVYYGDGIGAKLIEDFEILWAFDKETLKMTKNKREILKKQKEIEKLQNEIKELEKKE